MVTTKQEKGTVVCLYLVYKVIVVQMLFAKCCLWLWIQNLDAYTKFFVNVKYNGSMSLSLLLNTRVVNLSWSYKTNKKPSIYSIVLRDILPHLLNLIWEFIFTRIFCRRPQQIKTWDVFLGYYVMKFSLVSVQDVKIVSSITWHNLTYQTLN